MRTCRASTSKDGQEEMRRGTDQSKERKSGTSEAEAEAEAKTRSRAAAAARAGRADLRPQQQQRIGAGRRAIGFPVAGADDAVAASTVVVRFCLRFIQDRKIQATDEGIFR